MKKTQFFTNYSKIESWLIQMEIKNYNIDPTTLEVDVYDDVDIEHKQLISIPVKFRHILGSFICSYNSLTSLAGAPSVVNNHFCCAHNELTTLQYAPTCVYGDFDCSCNKLISLKGAPKYVGEDFDCDTNELTSLQGISNYIGGHIFCPYNKLSSLQKIPAHLHKSLMCDGNNNTVTTITKYIKSVPGIALFNLQSDVFYFMWVFFIKNLKILELYNATADQKQVGVIINKHLRGDKSGPACQIELIDAGLSKYIKI